MNANLRFLKKAWLVQAFLFCTACAGVQSRIDTAQELIVLKGLESKTLVTSPLPLFSAFKPGAISDPLRVVIEGDGYAWIDRNTLSDNPTPRDPVGLKIATSLNPPAYYLARPCQYVEAQGCDAALWSSDRFAPRVMESYIQALDQIKAQTGAQNFHLIGFSGGAYIALSLAARRSDIPYVTTVSGLLDPKDWTQFQDISPLQNLLPEETLLQNSQATMFRHFCGTEDEIVPCSLTQNLIQKSQKLGLSNHSLTVINGEDHQSTWEKALPDLN